jgi:ribonuclease BN (tRNA processing enzyme)
LSELVFVGTGDAFGAGGRRQSAMLLRTGTGAVLNDCGATTSGGLT